MNLPWLIVILLALAGLSLLAWSIKALDAAGAIAAFIIGLGVALAGDLAWLILMTAFTVVGVLATKLGDRVKRARNVAEARDGERGLKNVLANGLAAFLMAMMVPVVGAQVASIAFAAAVAAVMADTMASEIGVLARRSRLIAPPFDIAPPGRNGGVSWLGQFAAAAGALIIAGLSIPLLGLTPGQALIPAVAGFMGCQMDSILGATLERDDVKNGPLSKESVNFLASFTPAVIVLGTLWLI